MNKYRDVHLIFKKNEWERILQKSKKSKLTPGRYIKQIALNGKIKVLPPMQDADIIEKELNQIGRNINQIAALANTTKSMTQQDLIALTTKYKQIKVVFDEYLQLYLPDEYEE
ncbi:MAG: plasmid mobilization relaxosome protein MobC [Oscillospiraceae bacterium]|nr:plasmid mobilization relaxosome protein MobC [Oscillospiraceae bacterium]